MNSLTKVLNHTYKCASHKTFYSLEIYLQANHILKKIFWRILGIKFAQFCRYFKHEM
jgi:hypothetical protein